MTYAEYCALQDRRKKKPESKAPLVLTVTVNGQVVLTIEIPPP